MNRSAFSPGHVLSMTRHAQHAAGTEGTSSDPIVPVEAHEE